MAGDRFGFRWVEGGFQWLKMWEAMRVRDAEFEKIFKKYYPRILSFFLHHGISRLEAEDLTQETLLRAYRRIDLLRDEATLNTWLLTIASNIWKNQLRYQSASKRRGETFSIAHLDSLEGVEGEAAEIAPDLRSVPQIPPERPESLEAVLGEERRKILEEALENLPGQMRRILLLRAHGLTYREIAAAMNLSVDTVGAHISQAKSRLRTKLGPLLPTRE